MKIFFHRFSVISAINLSVGLVVFLFAVINLNYMSFLTLPYFKMAKEMMHTHSAKIFLRLSLPIL